MPHWGSIIVPAASVALAVLVCLKPHERLFASYNPSTPAPTMMTAIPSCITIPAATRHTATVVFVHGLGDSGHGWKPVADMFSADSALSHIKWVLPHSPERRVTANMGITMPSWFDIYSFGFNTMEDEAGMLASAESIKMLIKREVDSGVDPSRIVLGGFSQGACMSLLAGLTYESKLAGLAVLSGWLPLREKIKEMASPHAASLPVFWGHGALDQLVKFQFGKGSADFLVQQLGMPTATPPDIKGLLWTHYEGVGHSTNQQELDDLKNWIKKAIPKEGE